MVIVINSVIGGFSWVDLVWLAASTVQLQVSNYRKNRAANAPITFNEIVTVMISCETSPNLMLIVYTPGPGRDVMKFNS